MAASRSLMLALAVLGTLAVALMAWRMVEAPPEVSRLLVRPPAQTASVPAPAPAKPAAPIEKPQPAHKPPTLTFGWRLLPNGDLLIAGTTAPNADVSLKRAESDLAQARAQSTGDFVLLPPTLSPGDHDMVLVARSLAGEVRERVLIALPSPVAPPAGPKPTEAAAGPTPAPAPPQPQPAEVAIRSAEAGQRSAFQAAGSAPAGATVRLYLNDSFVADATASPEGAWSLRVERGMAPGHYELRADVVDQDGKVLSRAAVPFDYPEGPTAPAEVETAAAPPLATPAPPKPGEAVVPQIQSVRVVKGDSLWRISQRVLGDGQRYIQIYQANSGQIRNPNLIYPGQVLVTPQDKAQ